ncbi:MAG TPA: hypothetical protein VFR64_13170 [Methylomirabilota bacterium]|nr:hypothetical protein [Methylomirabilota bacterium]
MAERLARELARLHAVPLTDFVKTRDALARELRAARRTAEADAVAKLRKPTPAVWAINRVAREDPDAVARLVAVVDSLKRAHFGEPGPLAEATEAQRSTLEHVLERAKAVLANAGLGVSATVLGRMSATLLGAAADPEATAALRQGRLTHELPAPGFEALGGAPRARTARRDEAAAESRGSRVRDARRAAESRAREAEQRARQAEQVASERRQAAEQAAREVHDLRQRLREAERRARDARRAAKEAEAAASRVRRQADQADPTARWH